MPNDFISRSQARREFGFTAERLAQAIQRREIQARYTGTKTVKVRRADCERLIQTPPTQAVA